jgi:uncharacterized membrane protein YhhN
LKRLAFSLFITASVGELASVFLQHKFLHNLCKPLIVPLLMGYYWSSVPREQRSMIFLIALSFSFLGDTLLMYDDQDSDYFLWGLAAFLLSLTLYIITYRQHRWYEPEVALSGVQKVRLAFPVILGGTGLIVVLYPSLGSLRLPVVLYALVLISMVITALYRSGYTSNRSFWMVFLGSVLFLLSDSMLAINKFLEPVQLAGFWIMLLYISAQYLIVEGLGRHPNRM